MAISYVGIGATLTAATQNGVVAAPTSGIEPGDLMIMAAANRYSGLAQDHPGFISMGQFTGGIGANALDSGQVRLNLWYKVATGVENGMSVNLTKGASETGQIMVAKIAHWRKTSDFAEWFLSTQTDTYDHENGANWSATAPSNHNGGLRPGDVILPIIAVNGGQTAFVGSSSSHPDLTLTGTTFRAQNRSNSGHGITLIIGETTIVSGIANSGGLTHVMSHTNNLTNYPSGVTVFLRIRDEGHFRRRVVLID